MKIEKNKNNENFASFLLQNKNVKKLKMRRSGGRRIFTESEEHH